MTEHPSEDPSLTEIRERTVSDLLDLLEKTPATVRGLLEDLPLDLAHADEGPGTFSPFDVLGHLIEVELQEWVPRGRIIAEHGTGRPFEPFEAGAHADELARVGLEERLDQFERLRAEGVAVFRELAASVDPNARGTHPLLGEVTLTELTATWVVHDLDHIAQIARVVARQFGEAVGPWADYLPILDTDE